MGIRDGSRKQMVREAFDNGDDALAVGIELGLQKATVVGWLGEWKRQAAKAQEPFEAA
jgi:hypothetical protein